MGQPAKQDYDAKIRKMDARSQEEWSYSVGLQTYVFTLPLTMLERERKIRLDPVLLEKPKRSPPRLRSINLAT